MARLFWLSDAAWAVIEPHLPHGLPASRVSTTGAQSVACCMC